jgi:hypothetical protein
VNKEDYLLPQWAGYDDHGNDRNGHMHFHDNGNFYRSDGKRGFFCAAPLDDNGGCSDPIPYEERIVAQLDRHADKGETFKIGEEIHRVMGFSTGFNSEQFMYSAIQNEPDGLEFIRLWKLVPQTQVQHSAYYTTWALIEASDITVLDCIADKLIGFTR